MLDADSLMRNLRMVLSELKHEKLKEIKAVLDVNEGLRFPDLEKLTGSGEAAQAVLAELVNKELVVSELYDNFIVCPSCGSHKIIVGVACPICGSKKIVKSINWMHRACRHVDFADRFRVRDRLVCPGCGAEVKEADCEVYSILYSCDSCGASFAKPNESIQCDMSHKFTLDEARLQPLMVYRLNPAKETLIEELLVSAEELLKPFEEAGFTVKAPARIRGTSQVEHEIPFAVYRSNQSESPLVAGGINLQEKVTTEEVLAHWAKTIDLNAERSLFLAGQGATEDAKKTAQTLGMDLIEAEDLSALRRKIARYAERIKRTGEKSGEKDKTS